MSMIPCKANALLFMAINTRNTVARDLTMCLSCLWFLRWNEWPRDWRLLLYSEQDPPQQRYLGPSRHGTSDVVVNPI